MNSNPKVEFSFHIPGPPVPQGSKRAFVNKKTGRAQVVDDNRTKLSAWRADAMEAIERAKPEGWVPYKDAYVALTFTLERPKSVSAKKRPRPNVKPDLDKLARAVCDVLTQGKVLTDDAGITTLALHKRYARPSVEPRWSTPGTSVRVINMEDIELAKD